MKSLDSLFHIGKDLVRPECILCTQQGNQYVSDFRGGITQINKHGEQTFFGGTPLPCGDQLKPNGIALMEDGSFLAAHLGESRGGIYRVTRDNNIEPFLNEISGTPLPPSNFVYLDHLGRIWVTVSTRHQPRALAYRKDIQDGFIAVIDNGTCKIVADNIGYTNELCISGDGQYLYVNATFSRELLRFSIGSQSTLHTPTRITRFGHGIYPDGLTLDNEGFLWVTSIISNRVLRVNPLNGHTQIILEDAVKDHVDNIESAYKTHNITTRHLTSIQSKTLKNISSLAFGGTHLNEVFLGCLLGNNIAGFHSEYRGQTPTHWTFDN